MRQGYRSRDRKSRLFRITAARRLRLSIASVHGWEGVLKPVVTRYRSKVSRLYFRADAGFANPDVCEFLEAEGIKYAIRLAHRAQRLPSRRCGNGNFLLPLPSIALQCLGLGREMFAEVSPRDFRCCLAEGVTGSVISVLEQWTRL